MSLIWVFDLSLILVFDLEFDGVLVLWILGIVFEVLNLVWSLIWSLVWVFVLSLLCLKLVLSVAILLILSTMAFHIHGDHTVNEAKILYHPLPMLLLFKALILKFNFLVLTLL